MSRVAITRAVSRALERCELTHLERRVLDVDLARKQHVAYVDALRDAGCEVHELDELPDFPDSVFVEDTVVVLDNVAVLTRPGAASRQGEVDSMSNALAPFRKCVRIEAPATLDGGDVLRLGRVVHVGASARSNSAGIEQLRQLVTTFGYTVEAVSLTGCLHLKTAVTQVAQDVLLINPQWVDASRFPGYRTISVDPGEPFAANAVWLGDRVLYSASFLRTAERLRNAGVDVRVLDMSETEKAEGGVTCCSVIFEV
ncbi:MAG: arginine deiminase family protein [Dokdonella sp.]